MSSASTRSSGVTSDMQAITLNHDPKDIIRSIFNNMCNPSGCVLARCCYIELDKKVEYQINYCDKHKDPTYRCSDKSIEEFLESIRSIYMSFKSLSDFQLFCASLHRMRNIDTLYLSFPPHYDASKLVFPSKLHTLKFGHGVSEGLGRMSIQANLSVLDIGSNYNENIESSDLPPRLSVLLIGTEFNAQRTPLVLPQSLECFEMISNNQQSFDLIVFPKFLRRMKIHPDIVLDKNKPHSNCQITRFERDNFFGLK